MNRLLAAGGTPADNADRRVLRHAVMDQRVGDLTDALCAHDDDLCPWHFGDSPVIEAALELVWVFVPSEHGHDRIMLAMSDGNPGVVRTSNNGTNARNDFESDACLFQFLRFFGAAAKNVWVASLQAHHAFAFARFRDQHFVKLLLRERVIARPFATVDDLGFAGREAQQVRVHQRVINHDVRAREQLRAP